MTRLKKTTFASQQYFGSEEGLQLRADSEPREDDEIQEVGAMQLDVDHMPMAPSLSYRDSSDERFGQLDLLTNSQIPHEEDLPSFSGLSPSVSLTFAQSPSLLTSNTSLDDTQSPSPDLPCFGTEYQTNATIFDPSEERNESRLPRRHYSFAHSTDNAMSHPNVLPDLDNDIEPNDFDEEILRANVTDSDATNLIGETTRVPSPTPSHESNTSTVSSMTLYAQPLLASSSPEMLSLRFDRETCGILSVKDGPTENPWRTLVWPLARESPALYHAISSMTAFHGSADLPELKVQGMSHMTKSIKRLATDISNMTLDAALATSLALAFSEGWDEHISTGIRHLKGAKIMVNNALIRQRRDVHLDKLDLQAANRLRFLCNAFIYMDVIARLSSLEEDNDPNFDEILTNVNLPVGNAIEVDPLMGCASTLFPLIGKAANLIQKARKTTHNSIALVSQANELKQMVLQWQVPSIATFERPEDPHSEVQHAVQTAEAYRLAILLYLHQAFPEIPSEPAHVLGRQILMTIASVPLASRTTIVQIFPLLVASCEATELDDRQWVTDRWQALMSRLKIGNVVICYKLVREVWRRRDAHEAMQAQQRFERYASRGMPNGATATSQISNGKRRAFSMNVPDHHSLASALHDFQQDQTLHAMHRDPTHGAFNSQHRTSHSWYATASPRLVRLVSDPGPNNIDPEYTVRGPLHWVGVMTDWKWEGKSLTLN